MRLTGNGMGGTEDRFIFYPTNPQIRGEVNKEKIILKNTTNEYKEN